MTRTLFLLVPLLFSPVFHPSQDQDDKPSEPQGTGTDFFGRPIRGNSSGGNLHQLMQGSWQLVGLEDPSLPGVRYDGYLLVGGSVLAFELHGNDGDALLFHSGIHDFEVIEHEGRISSSTIIGAFLTDDEELTPEGTGQQRDFRVQVDAGSLTLRKDDGTVFRFRRRLGRGGSKVDFFGRRKPAEASGSDNR